jgi:hypothetical protein
VALFLTVPGPKGSTAYRVSPLDPHPDVARWGWRLTKTDGVSYDVTLGVDGTWACDCRDYIARRESAGQLCKHLSQLGDAGLLGRKRA